MAKEINKKTQEAEKEAPKKSKVEIILEKYSKVITITFCVGIVLAAAIFCFVRFVQQPRKIQALADSYNAEYSFQAGDYKTALEGNEEFLGFADVIAEYGMNAPKSAYFYAGVCELRAGNYDEAISYLKKYKGKDPYMSARAKCCIGDAYVGLEDYANAASWFKKAIAVADNAFCSRYYFKAGLAYEAAGEKAKALDCYKTIKESYANSEEALEIDKYISRIETVNE